ncbi:hypothetical protein NDN08_003903 [Rhodosorus marinus]|uniref:DNA damage-binding protein 1 n=1 Tax=Rhodosorus marinus TaxID=101924 RepID=A0AAV8UK34_9RHOD|nr:hypothetical protein NDN08_003903 [Rhodosorus marinus]
MAAVVASHSELGIGLAADGCGRVLGLLRVSSGVLSQGLEARLLDFDCNEVERIEIGLSPDRLDVEWSVVGVEVVENTQGGSVPQTAVLVKSSNILALFVLDGLRLTWLFDCPGYIVTSSDFSYRSCAGAGVLTICNGKAAIATCKGAYAWEEEHVEPLLILGQNILLSKVNCLVLEVNHRLKKPNYWLSYGGKNPLATLQVDGEDKIVQLEFGDESWEAGKCRSKELVSNFNEPAAELARCAAFLSDGSLAVCFAGGEVILYSKSAPRSVVTSIGDCPIAMTIFDEYLIAQSPKGSTILHICGPSAGDPHQVFIPETIGCLLVLSFDSEKVVPLQTSQNSLEVHAGAPVYLFQSYQPESENNQFSLIESHLAKRLCNGIQNLSEIANSIEKKRLVQDRVARTLNRLSRTRLKEDGWHQSMPTILPVWEDLKCIAGSKSSLPQSDHELEEEVPEVFFNVHGWGKTLFQMQHVVWAKVRTNRKIGGLRLVLLGEQISSQTRLSRVVDEEGFTLLSTTVLSCAGMRVYAAIVGSEPRLLHELGWVSLSTDSVQKMPADPSTTKVYHAIGCIGPVKSELLKLQEELHLQIEDNTQDRFSRLSVTAPDPKALTVVDELFRSIDGLSVHEAADPEIPASIFNLLRNEQLPLEQADTDEAISSYLRSGHY